MYKYFIPEENSVSKKNIKIRFVAFIPVIILAFSPLKISANQTNPSNIIITSCGERQIVINSLKKDYKEVQDSIGISNRGGLIELFVSPKGSFSITLTNPNQITCIISAGEYWNKKNNLVSMDQNL